MTPGQLIEQGLYEAAHENDRRLESLRIERAKQAAPDLSKMSAFELIRLGLQESKPVQPTGLS